MLLSRDESRLQLSWIMSRWFSKAGAIAGVGSSSLRAVRTLTLWGTRLFNIDSAHRPHMHPLSPKKPHRAPTTAESATMDPPGRPQWPHRGPHTEGLSGDCAALPSQVPSLPDDEHYPRTTPTQHITRPHPRHHAMKTYDSHRFAPDLAAETAGARHCGPQGRLPLDGKDAFRGMPRAPIAAHLPNPDVPAQLLIFIVPCAKRGARVAVTAPTAVARRRRSVRAPI